ncbi:hypothetical protein L2E82_12698 [Cichorium intybus]|uniref:Uncharacterized protein n=1 Tax=Cichorium intybus TaxID=13427 RepID=A0ACB9GHZ9_CICIN|nr:hypothetical protein L2E82_12698 [Cichorium intybus]
MNPTMTNPNLLSTALVSLIAFVSIFSVDASRRLADVQQFGYTTGAPNEPTKWGSLRADWKTCETGKSQSPINLDEMQADIIPADLKMTYKDAPAKIVNEGFDINIEWQGDAGGIEINGTIYGLVHSHWHIPSEHTIDGKKFDAELHLVHSNGKEELAVMACFYTIGEPDPLLQSLADKIKTLGGTKVTDAGTISASNIKCGGLKYFRYMGSLTTPPCAEGVTWTIAAKAKTISEEQIQMIKGAVPREFQENARPTQALGGRIVTQFDFAEEQ